MEVLLNLLWLLVATALCGGCIAAGRRDQLRLPLRLALTCSVVLALLLLPAISMTDDLQGASAEIEVRARHMLELPLATAFLPGVCALALLLTSAFVLLVRQRLAARLTLQGRLPSRTPRFRPTAIRPPTPLQIAR